MQDKSYPQKPRSSYRIWYADYASKYIDSQLAMILDKPIDSCEGGRVRMTRKALLLSSVEMAKRLGIAPNNYLKFEKNDESGYIQLTSLNKIAAAMDCDFVYFLRPRNRRRYSEILWNRLEATAKEANMYVYANPARRDRILYASAKRTMANPTFARAQKWSQRRMRMFYGSE